ncbi:MAG: sigma-70 family RNA polymerase sigma factor [Terriglobales bacterium]
MPKTVEKSDEAVLIERILDGEKELFYELIRPYERSVFLTAYSVLKNEADAEEVAQESFLKAFRHLDSFRGDARFHTWLVRIVLNEARMRFRKDRKHLFDSIDAEPAGELPPHSQRIADWREVPSEILERTEVRAEIVRALAELSESYREVLILRDVQQLSISETADVLGVTPATVKIRLFRARLRLRDHLAPRLAESFKGRSSFRKGKKPW